MYSFVGGKDIPLPTGYGKSILLPLVFERMGGDVGSIVCVFRRQRPAVVTLQGSYTNNARRDEVY